MRPCTVFARALEMFDLISRKALKKKNNFIYCFGKHQIKIL